MSTRNISKRQFATVSVMDSDQTYDRIVIRKSDGTLLASYPGASAKDIGFEVGELAGVHEYVYTPSNGKWEYDGAYYTRAQLKSSFGIEYSANVEEKTGDKIYVTRRPIVRDSYNGEVLFADVEIIAEYVRSGNIFFIETSISQITNGSPFDALLFRSQNGYNFQGMYLNPDVIQGDDLRYEGRLYNLANYTLTFGKHLQYDVDAPSMQDSQMDEGTKYTSDELSTTSEKRAEALSYAELIEMVRSKLSASGSGNGVWWSFGEGWGVYFLNDSKQVFYMSRNAAYFTGNVYAKNILFGNNVGPNGTDAAGTIPSGAFGDESIPKAALNSSVQTELDKIDGIYVAMNGNANTPNYSPYLSGIKFKVNNAKKSFEPRQITYLDGSGTAQTITVLAMVETT